MAQDGFKPNRDDHEKLSDRHHADPPTSTTGFCIRNELFVRGYEEADAKDNDNDGKIDEPDELKQITSKDWSYFDEE